jgi:hypothetical protein
MNHFFPPNSPPLMTLQNFKERCNALGDPDTTFSQIDNLFRKVDYNLGGSISILEFKLEFFENDEADYKKSQ